MINLRYPGEEIAYGIEFESISDTIVQVTGRFPVKEKGFILFRDSVEDDPWDYSGYKTVYREIEGGAQFSNDSSVYVKPLPKVTFTAGFGGNVEGEGTQEAEGYEELDIPAPVPEENYAFTGWVPEIPAAGAIDGDKAFVANFTYVPTLEEAKEAKVAEFFIS